MNPIMVPAITIPLLESSCQLTFSIFAILLFFLQKHQNNSSQAKALKLTFKPKKTNEFTPSPFGGFAFLPTIFWQ